MSHLAHEAKLRITRPAGSELRIDCSLEMPAEGVLDILRGQSPSLVMDPSRPTIVGWRWIPPQDSANDERDDTHRLPPLCITDEGQISFSYALGSGDEVNAFFPKGESTYLTRAETEPGTGTLWFPLPVGRTIHALGLPLNFDGRSLVYFICDWSYERRRLSSFPFAVDDNVARFDSDGVYILCNSTDGDANDWIEIPAELLQDPIRNGSEYLEYGFNPWNEDQKARIIAHLETELVRLTESFLGDATDDKREVGALGQVPPTP